MGLKNFLVGFVGFKGLGVGFLHQGSYEGSVEVYLGLQSGWFVGWLVCLFTVQGLGEGTKLIQRNDAQQKQKQQS